MERGERRARHLQGGRQEQGAPALFSGPGPGAGGPSRRVDRQPSSWNDKPSEVIDKLLALKLEYPDRIFLILGNHDLKRDYGSSFVEILKTEPNYKLLYGNLLFIFLSDSERGKPTEISKETFKWWKELVVNNQDKIIIVVTHAPLEGSSIAFSSLNDRQITDSERFTDVLEDYQVDLWLSGHLHLPNAFTNTIVKKEDLSETIFVHISSIRTELFGLKNSESRIITFYCDSDKISIYSRDHDSREWDRELTREFNLSKVISCAHEK